MTMFSPRIAIFSLSTSYGTFPSLDPSITWPLLVNLLSCPLFLRIKWSKLHSRFLSFACTLLLHCPWSCCLIKRTCVEHVFDWPKLYLWHLVWIKTTVNWPICMQDEFVHKASAAWLEKTVAHFKVHVASR